MLPPRRNNTRAGGIIKNQGREGVEEYTKEQSMGGRDMIYIIRRLCRSVSSFRAKFLARIPASDLDSSFIRPSFSNSIDPIQHSTHPGPSVHSSVQERERLDHAVGEQTDRPTQRPIRSFAGPPARPSAVVKSSTFRISRDYIPFLCSPDAARAATPAAVR